MINGQQPTDLMPKEVIFVRGSLAVLLAGGLLLRGAMLGGGVSARAPAAGCAELQGRKIAPSAIGFPTTGATVVAASLVAATPLSVEGTRAVLPTPEYCRVTGFISPVDPSAPRINFHVNLPTDWNGKLAQMGGSGQNGVIPVALTTAMQFGPESIPPDAPYALSRGFVTYGSDSGHQSPPPAGRGGRGAEGAAPPPPDSGWMSNKEALHNFLFMQMKKTHDVTVDLVKLLYDRPIRHSYYLGSSQGGREALMVAQRFPQDYDGIFVQVPVFPYGYLTVFDSLYRSRSQFGDAWLPPTKVSVIAAEVRRQCDALDGIEDGLVGNYMACDRRFDPAINPDALARIRCAEGKETGDSCLSDPQIRAANAVHATLQFPFPLAHGWTSMPGWPTGSESANNWKVVATRPEPGTPVSGALRTITNEPDATIGSIDLTRHRAAIQEYSALADGSNPDLSAFYKRGGKMIMKVNTTDYTANPRWSYAYYDKVVKTMGQDTADRFLRLYVAVGIFHGRNVGRNPLTSELVPSYVDFIALLDDWVEKGKAPADTQVLRDIDTAPPFTVRGSFPMCRYPAYPRYRGTGNPKEAGSYQCVR